MLKLFLISQNINQDYDTFDSAVVVAKNENSARKIHPNISVHKDWWKKPLDDYSSWVNSKDVEVQFIGNVENPKLKNKQVVCASYNAG